MPSGPTRSSPAPAEPRRPPAGQGDTGSAWSRGAAGRCGPRAGSSCAPSRCPDPGQRIDTLMLAGGAGADGAAADEQLVGWIRAVAPRCRRVATVCSGTFIAAAAGLLDGRRVTTHWARATELAAAHPALTVDADPIYIRDGKVLVQRRRHRRHRPVARPGAGRPRRRSGPDRRPLAGHVPAPPGRPDPVRLAGMGATGRTLHHSCGADTWSRRRRRRPPAAGARPPRRP